MRATESIMVLIVAGALTLQTGCSSSHVPTNQASSNSSPDDARIIESNYRELMGEIEEYNAQVEEINSWGMSSEHLFVGDGDLAERVIRFDRQPGVLDFLFDRLLDANTGSDETLAIAEMLVYAGEYYQSPNEVIRGGRRADEVIAAANGGRFSATEKKYPLAPIREKILVAANRASQGNKREIKGVGSL